MPRIVVVLAVLLGLAVAAAHGRLPDATADAVHDGTYHGKSAGQWIRTLSSSEDENERRRAAYALGQIQPTATEAIPALSKALDDPKIEVCWYAVDALGQMGPAAGDAAGAIIAAIENPDNNETHFLRSGAKTLGRIGPAAGAGVLLLEKALKSDDAVLRVEAALALWKIARHEKSLPVLFAILKNESLKSESPNGKSDEPSYRACMAICEIAPDPLAAEKPLVLALGHADPDVRRAAAGAVGQLGLPVVPFLTRALREWDKIDKERAAVALGIIADQTRRDVLYRSGVSLEEFAAAASPLYKLAVPALIALLDETSRDVRRTAARSLAKMGPMAVPPLLATLGSGNSAASESAAEALMQLESPYLPRGSQINEGVILLTSKSLQPLIATMGHEDVHVRAAAFRLFAALSLREDARQAEPLLRDALRGENVTIRRYAAKALDQMREKP